MKQRQLRKWWVNGANSIQIWLFCWWTCTVASGLHFWAICGWWVPSGTKLVSDYCNKLFIPLEINVFIPDPCFQLYFQTSSFFLLGCGLTKLLLCLVCKTQTNSEAAHYSPHIWIYSSASNSNYGSNELGD